ncbi:MAG TPA: hypothetical protein PKA64_08575 [Myxococcota bacterium]|nr:hypothetical protein [Myxococcota bacterium]
MDPIRLRVAAMLLIGGWMVASPFLVQVVGVKERSLRAWRMFSGLNVDVCEVQLWRRTDAGDAPVDRLGALGFEGRLDAPNAEALVKNLDGARAQATKICAKLGRGVDLRADVRCGSLSGWVERMHREEDLCAPKPKGER